MDAPDEVKEKYYYEAQSLSKEWVACACGQLCKRLPRNEFGAPKDARLCFLGFIFCNSICNRDYTKAKKTLHLIEERTLKLSQ